MKKLYYFVFVLVMLMTGMVTVACGGDDEEEFDISGNGRTFLFAFDDDMDRVKGNNIMDLEDYLNPIYYVGWPNEANHFAIDRPGESGQFHIDFSQEEESFFKVGYSGFGKDASSIVYITTYWQGWYGEFVSGDAKVISNNGEYITIQFSKFKCKVEDRNEREHTILLDGTLKFYVYRY